MIYFIQYFLLIFIKSANYGPHCTSKLCLYLLICSMLLTAVSCCHYSAITVLLLNTNGMVTSKARVVEGQLWAGDPIWRGPSWDQEERRGGWLWCTGLVLFSHHSIISIYTSNIKAVRLKRRNDQSRLLQEGTALQREKVIYFYCSTVVLLSM